MLTVADIGFEAAAALLARHGLQLAAVPGLQPIPGSFWGECEAGVIASSVFARADTPVHSLLHEAAHLLVMPEARRSGVHTDASDSLAEEDAACYLQILLARELKGVGGARLMADMDAWGYSFRLGSARAWYDTDAEDARNFLQASCAQLWQSLPSPEQLLLPGVGISNQRQATAYAKPAKAQY